MCTVCGLPTNHTTPIVETLKWLSLVSFGLTTYLGAHLVLARLKLKAALSKK